LCDLQRPRLVWDSEYKAMKNNINVLIYLLICMLIAAVVLIVGIMFLKSPITAFISLAAIEALLAYACYAATVNRAVTLINRLSV